MTRNHEVLLASYPEAMPDEGHFIHQPCDMPAEGGVRLRTIWLSVDPYLRGRMAPVKSYIPPFEPGKRIESHCVAEVMASDNPAFAAGDVLLLPISDTAHAREAVGATVKAARSLHEHYDVLGVSIESRAWFFAFRLSPKN